MALSFIYFHFLFFLFRRFYTLFAILVLSVQPSEL